MKLQQLRYTLEVYRHNLNVSEAAEALFTSQPGISKQIRLLEDELGIQIFIRNGKRVVAVSEPGKQVLQVAERMLRDAQNIKKIGAEFSEQDAGSLTIATTHTQARYVLPPSVAKLREAYPKVNVSLHQTTPDQVARMVIDEVADIGMATESLADYPELVTLPCYEWQHVLVVPATHALAKKERLTLEDIAAEPLITYHPSFTGRTRIDTAFAQRNLAPRIVLEAIDSDVIKTYVRLGLGIGIVAEMAVDGDKDPDLVTRPLGQLLGKNVARIALKRGAYLRDFVYHFASLLSDRLDKDLILKAMNGHVADYEL